MRREWTCHPASSPLTLSGEQPVPSELSPPMSDRPYAAFCRCMYECEHEHLKISLVCFWYMKRLYSKTIHAVCIKRVHHHNDVWQYFLPLLKCKFTQKIHIYLYYIQVHFWQTIGRSKGRSDSKV